MTVTDSGSGSPNTNKKKLKVVLTGTTGNLGSSVLKHILTLIPRSSIIISLYNSAQKPADTDGIEIREGNYEDPQSLDKAYAGADILFLMSYPSIGYQVRVDAHTNAIEAAKRNSIKHIVYTSVAYGGAPSSSDSVSAVMKAHLTTEKYLKTQLPSHMTYTILREGLYTESFPFYLSFYDISEKPSEVYVPPGDNDELIAFTKRDELGEATAKVITQFVNSPNGNLKFKEENEFVNKTILLSANPQHSLRSLGELIGRIAGPPVEIRYTSTEEYSASGGKAASFIGTSELAKDWATNFIAIGKGEASFVGEGSRELERILGRKPEDVEVTLRGMFAGRS